MYAFSSSCLFFLHVQWESGADSCSTTSLFPKPRLTSRIISWCSKLVPCLLVPLVWAKCPDCSCVGSLSFLIAQQEHFHFSHVTPWWMELIFAVLKIKAFPCKILLCTFTITHFRNACPSRSWDSFYLDIYRDVCEFLERELLQVWLVLSIWTAYIRGNSVPSCICESCNADGKSFYVTYSMWLEEVEIIPSLQVICPLVFHFFHCLPPLPQSFAFCYLALHFAIAFPMVTL